MTREIVFIGFGSNQGNRDDYCDRAVTLLGLVPFSQMTGVSSLYETQPVTDSTDPGPGWFLNGVVRLETELRARRVLDMCREVEHALGRDEEIRGGPRTLDLDILFYGSHVLREDGLEIPHPRLHLRRFVLVPLEELDPEWRHPVLGRTSRELLRELNDPCEVRRLDRPPSSRYGSRLTCGIGPTDV